MRQVRELYFATMKETWFIHLIGDIKRKLANKDTLDYNRLTNFDAKTNNLEQDFLKKKAKFMVCVRLILCWC